MVPVTALFRRPGIHQHLVERADLSFLFGGLDILFLRFPRLLLLLGGHVRSSAPRIFLGQIKIHHGGRVIGVQMQRHLIKEEQHFAILDQADLIAAGFNAHGEVAAVPVGLQGMFLAGIHVLHLDRGAGYRLALLVLAFALNRG